MPRGSCYLPSGRLEKTTRSSPHHVAQHRPTGYETTPPYAPRSSRFGSEPPSVEDDVDVWCYAILELHARNDDDNRHNGQFQTYIAFYTFLPNCLFRIMSHVFMTANHLQLPINYNLQVPCTQARHAVWPLFQNSCLTSTTLLSKLFLYRELADSPLTTIWSSSHFKSNTQSS